MHEASLVRRKLYTPSGERHKPLSFCFLIDLDTAKPSSVTSMGNVQYWYPVSSISQVSRCEDEDSFSILGRLAN